LAGGERRFGDFNFWVFFRLTVAIPFFAENRRSGGYSVFLPLQGSVLGGLVAGFAARTALIHPKLICLKRNIVRIDSCFSFWAHHYARYAVLY
jgi:hypothetical protein